MSLGLGTRAGAVVLAAVALTAAASALASRLAGGDAARIGLTVAIATPIALLVASPWLRRTGDLLRAVEDGLSSFGEREYSVRITPERAGGFENVVRRFNELGARLRAENNDVYQKEIMLASVLETAPMAIVLCNEAGRVVLGNTVARELFLEGRRLDGHRFEELLGVLPQPVRDAIGRREDALVPVELSTGAESWHVAARVFELSTQRHTLYTLRNLGREMDRQEAETWKRAIRLISHELNNSLAPVTSLTHSARKIVQGPDAAAKLAPIFDTIEERTSHLQTFLESYARFARLPKPTRQRSSWSALLASAQPLYTFRVAGTPPEHGWFDPVQMQQVLINLLKNASESGSPPGEIEVEVGPAPSGAVLWVRDRGRGMTDETLKRALLPFYSTKRSGTGLGLSLCREIVEAHGGRLTLRVRDGGGVEVECLVPGAPD